MTDNAKYPDTARGHVRAFLDTFERDSANDLTFSGVIAANMTPDDPVLTINALHGLLADGIRVERELTEAHATLNAAYRERAHLVALLAAVYPSHIGRTDPTTPDWAVVTLQLPTGQAAWHISADDEDLFQHVEHDPEHAFEYDGHSTEEKYQRIRMLTAEIAEVQEAAEPDVMAVPVAEVRRAEEDERDAQPGPYQLRDLTDDEARELRARFEASEAAQDERDGDVRAVAALLKLGDTSFRGNWLTDYDDARSELESRFADRIAALVARDAEGGEQR